MIYGNVVVRPARSRNQISFKSQPTRSQEIWHTKNVENVWKDRIIDDYNALNHSSSWIRLKEKHWNNWRLLP